MFIYALESRIATNCVNCFIFASSTGITLHPEFESEYKLGSG